MSVARDERRSDGARPSALLTVVDLLLGGEEYCVPVEQVLEVLRCPEITHLPHQPEFISGIMRLRGHAIPVIDLRVRFGLAAETHPKLRVLVTVVRGLRVGFIVDAVRAVKTLEAETIRPLPPGLTAAGSAFLRGVAPARKESGRWLMLLDLDRILHPGEERQLLAVPAE